MCFHGTIKSGMQMVAERSCTKTGQISSAVRSASCSHGWLHLAVQMIFGALTVASFVMIVIWTLPKVTPREIPHSRCHLQGCRVICKNAPYFEDNDNDIVQSVARAGDDGCKRIQLTLNKPMFVNETLPVNFLSPIRYRLHELGIFGGNLRHIPNEAFMNQYTGNIESLLLHDLTIVTWTRTSFIGLSNLRQIHIRQCEIHSVEVNALRPVIESLECLTITESGHWNPISVTGITELQKLTTVDFSSNKFYNVLNKHSFTGLTNCKILYLNSCKISSLGPGTFDSLHNIQILYLNNNRLTNVPDGLFYSIINISVHRPRINLQDNQWHCDCAATDLIQLSTMDMLLSDPYCATPEQYEGKKLSQIKCAEEEKPITIIPSMDFTGNQNISQFIYVSYGCYDGNRRSENSALKMYSPVEDHQCHSSASIYRKDIESDHDKEGYEEAKEYDWIKLSFLLKTENYSLVQIGARKTETVGLIWYLSTCPNEVYCMNSIPSSFRVYNADLSAQYIFCPIALSSGIFDRKRCVVYQPPTNQNFDRASRRFHIYLYICSGFLCVAVGAILVYALIRKYPNLLRGSNRILFVKHKTVNALVLPPTVPLRKEILDECKKNYNDSKIFIVPDAETPMFSRMKSTRSSKSNAPSYVSALQPTEDQLAEWRIRNHFYKDFRMNSENSDISTYSWFSNGDSVFHSLGVDIEATYESLK